MQGNSSCRSFTKKQIPISQGSTLPQGLMQINTSGREETILLLMQFPPLSKLILHKTITQLETHELKNNNLKTVFNIASV